MTDYAERDAPDGREAGADRNEMAAEAAPEAGVIASGTSEAMGGDVGTLRRQLEEQRDKYLRLAAEYDNFRRRAMRERAEAEARGQAELAKKIIEPLDDLARFAHLDPTSTDAKTVIEGAAMVERKLQKALSAAGLTVIDPVDQTFDPNLHEAVTTEPAMSPEDDHVVSKVFQLGYLFNGQLLRPARVVVKQWNG